MTDQNKPDIVPPKLPSAKRSLVFEPMGKEITFVNAFETLLKRPGAIIFEMHEKQRGKLTLMLFLTMVVSLLLFGAAVGTFSLGHSLWIAPMKILLGILISGVICLPSLYIFSCLSGLDIRFAPLAGILVAVLSLSSLLLLGLTPIVWVFSQSTDSLQFMGFLNLIFWIIATFFGFQMLMRASRFVGDGHSNHLRVWVAIFMLVSFQMTTTLRPIMGPSDKLFTNEKKFFLNHWFEQTPQ